MRFRTKVNYTANNCSRPHQRTALGVCEFFSIGVELTKVTKGQLNLDKNYRLISDEHNFILQRKVPLRTKKRAGKTKEWRNVGY